MLRDSHMQTNLARLTSEYNFIFYNAIDRRMMTLTTRFYNRLKYQHLNKLVNMEDL